MSRKVVFKRNRKNAHYLNAFDVSFTALTKGEIMAMRNALISYSGQSVVARDVLCYVNNGLSDYPESELRDLLFDSGGKDQ